MEEITPQKGLELLLDFYKGFTAEKEIVPTIEDLNGVSDYILTCFYDTTQIKEKQTIKMQITGKDTGRICILGTLTNLFDSDNVEFKSRDETYYIRKDLLGQCKPTNKVNYSEKKIEPKQKDEGVLYLQAFEIYDDEVRAKLDAMYLMTCRDTKK